MKIRSFSIPYCVKKKREKVEFQKSLENELKILHKEIDSDTSNVNHETYHSKKRELVQIENHEINGLIFRSNVKWTEDGETISKYFLALEKRNYANKLISTLEIDGKITKNNNEISKAQSNFYKNLYSEKLNQFNESYQNSLDSFLESKNIPKLDEKQKEICHRKIDETKILKNLKYLHNGKTPGTDGLLYYVPW